jgi:hypothetical protein
MASLYKRLMDTRTIGGNELQPPAEAMDVGAYTKLEIQPRVLKAATTGSLKIMHSAVAEIGSFAELTTISLTATSNTPLSFTNFLRYISWEAVSVTGSAVVVVDVVAKQG